MILIFVDRRVKCWLVPIFTDLLFIGTYIIPIFYYYEIFIWLYIPMLHTILLIIYYIALHSYIQLYWLYTICVYYFTDYILYVIHYIALHSAGVIYLMLYTSILYNTTPGGSDLVYYIILPQEVVISDLFRKLEFHIAYRFNILIRSIIIMIIENIGMT